MRKDLFKEKASIGENARRDKFLQRQLERAGAAISDKTETLSYTGFITYYKTGSRKEYENEYFEHRRQLCAYTILAAVYPENEKFLHGLENIIWAVSDEFSWALPAHIPEDADPEACVEHIDLFAAETAFSLAEAADIIGDRLDKRIRDRIKFEVRRRVIDPYLSGRKNGWDTVGSNWAAVCAGSVGAAFLYLAEEDEIKTAMPRLLKTLQCYIDSFGDDGACTEGINYWIYGFGYFTYFAELLYQYTDGEIDLFSIPKTKAIALFPQKIRFSNDRTVTFSDCGDKFINRSGLACFLSRKYDGVIAADDGCALGFDDDACYRAAHIVRDFAWRSNGMCNGGPELGTYYFVDAAWYIKKNETYEFAAKAGNNNESHNHNDIGAFILNAGGNCVVTDPGRGEYTAEYFGNGRYSSFAPSSRAHSVPMINGGLQVEGAEHKGEITKADDDRLSIRFEKAYNDTDLSLLKREFIFKSGYIILRDEAVFESENGSITERLVTELKPEPCAGGMKIGDVKLLYDTSAHVCSVAEHTFPNGYDSVKTVYTLDIEFGVKGRESIMELIFEFWS